MSCKLLHRLDLSILFLGSMILDIKDKRGQYLLMAILSGTDYHAVCQRCVFFFSQQSTY